MSAEDRRYLNIALIAIAAITAIRVAVLILSPLERDPDEAQYWGWSHNPDWGYFSKPPMRGWVILLTTAFFGNAECAILIG